LIGAAGKARHPVPCGPHLLGSGALFAIAGPDVLESLELGLATGRALAEAAARLGIALVFKSSYLKANRSSHDAYVGPGLERGLEMLAEVKRATGLAILTDVHSIEEVEPAAEVADVLQIPAFLSRQTFLIRAAAETGRVVNLKKGQFLAPDDMVLVAEKATRAGNRRLILTERGTSFGYHDLVVDMRGFARMRGLGFPVAFDASHAVQRPSGTGRRSDGDRRGIPALARAALAAGADGVFVETHPEPDRALCDPSSHLALDDLPRLLDQLVALDELKRGWAGDG